MREHVFSIDTSSPARRFCVVDEGSRIFGPLRDQIPNFVSQTFFEVVAITTEDGTILVTNPQGTERSSSCGKLSRGAWWVVGF
jgi:hypothetical protein